MIEIKNKRIILYPTDRLIGAEGDIETAKKVFILDKEEAGCDLSQLVAWIKLNPKGSGENAYNQKLKKEIIGDKIKLTWNLTGANLKNAGELEAQIIMASPDYFNASELESLDDNSPILPSIISGVSAPVWQSYKETFVVADSIDDAISYREITKNVLIAAVADAAESAESAAEAAEAVNEGLEQINEKVLAAESHKNSAEAGARAAENAAAVAENTAIQTSEHLAGCKASSEHAVTYAMQAQDTYYEVEFLNQKTMEYANRIAGGSMYRKIFSKTIAEGDSIAEFNINRDMNGNAFKLREFAVYITFPKTSDITGYLRVEAKGEATAYNMLCQFIGSSTTDTIYTRIECKNLGRWITSFVSGKYLFANAGTPNVSSSVGTQNNVIDGLPVTDIKFYQRQDPKPLPVGTEFEIWGLDCIEAVEG